MARASTAAPSRSDADTIEALVALKPARRLLRGHYSASMRGRVAIDGNVLDLVVAGQFAASSAWRSPNCEMCWRPERLWMVPLDHRWCSRHGLQTPSREDPFPLEGDELLRAKERAWSYARPRLGVPMKYEACSIERSVPTPAMTFAADYCGGDRYVCRGVIIFGNCGCGKSWTMRAIQRELVLEALRDSRHDDLKDCEGIRWYDFPELVTALLSTEQRAKTMERCIDADELLIDDAGSSYVKPGGLAVGILEEIFVAREQHDASMVVSTNLKPRDFRRVFGPRVFDRLAGDWGVWLDVSAPSMRRKAPRT
jgi:hypothetical protein